MNKRPGHVNVTVETGYCNFCGRTRNLRREEHQLGTLVRTIMTCETCHRTLSSLVGVAAVEPEAVPVANEIEVPVQPAAEPKAKAPAKAAGKAKGPARAAAKTPAKPKRASAQAASSAKAKASTKRASTKKK